MVVFNRVAWMVIFLSGTMVFIWMISRDGSSSEMVWFLLTSLWSAFCGIGYTVLHWFIVGRTPGESCKG